MTVRLPEDLQKQIDGIARKMKLKRSDVVRMALVRFAEQMEAELEDKPFDRVKHLLGSVSSGVPDLGSAHREHLLEKLGRRA